MSTKRHFVTTSVAAGTKSAKTATRRRQQQQTARERQDAEGLRQRYAGADYPVRDDGARYTDHDQ